MTHTQLTRRTRYELQRNHRFGLAVLCGLTLGMFTVVLSIWILFGK